MEPVDVKAQKERERVFRENDAPYGVHVKNKKNRLFNEIELRAVAHFLSATPGCSVLDICCADGRFLEYLDEKGPRCAMFGTDFARNPLSLLLKKHFRSHAICCDASALPIRSSSVSRTVSIQSFHHLASPEERLKAMREAFRVLTKGGKFVVTVVNRETWRHQVENGVEGPLLSCRDLFVHLYTGCSLQRDLEKAGFEVVTVAGINCLPNRYLALLGRAGIRVDLLITRFFPVLSMKKGTYLLAECVKK